MSYFHDFEELASIDYETPNKVYYHAINNSGSKGEKGYKRYRKRME